MSTTIKLRRSAVPGRVPTTSQLELGEIAINTADGKLYFKRYDPGSNTESIVDMSADLDANAILDLLKGVDGANSGLDADLLDGEHGSYYLDYNNFVNVPPASFDLTLTGKVTGTAFSNTGVMTLVTELANTGVTAGEYGSASLVPIITIDEDGRITSANTVSVAGVDNTYWTVANNTFTIETADGGAYNTVIEDFTDITVNDLTANNIIVNGLVDGRDIAADGAKLDLLEDGLDLTLTGKVTGFASSNTGVMTLATELANTGVTAGTYGSSTAIPVLTIDEDGRITVANTAAVSGVENLLWTSANNTLTLETGDGTIYNIIIDTFDDIETGDITANNIIVSGLVDGRDISVDGAKLDRIEENLTVTLTGKVTGTVTSNTGTMSVSTELANTGVTAGTYGSSTAIPIITIDEDGRITLANTASVAGVDDFFWTSSNNTLILQTGDGSSYLVPIETFTDIEVDDLTANNIIVSGLVDGRDVSADGSKLDGIETGATADQTASEILSLLLTVDGTGTGLDADLLDGQHASDIIAAAVGEAGGSVGNGNVQISSGSGLSGSGSFNLNDFSNTTITISHTDTSSVADVNNSNGSVIQDITFDTFGHVLTVGSVDLDGRYYTETELNNGQLDNRYYTETELNNGQLDNRYYTETEINTNFYTKTQLDAGQLDNRYYTETELNNGQLDNRYYTETELNNGQLDTRYYTETELNNGQLDTRYYTETESDNRFVNTAGDTMTGELTVNALISQEHSSFVSATSTKTSTSQSVLYAFPFATYSAAEVIITANQSNNRHVTKLLITHDGSTAIATEYGTVFTNAELASYNITISAAVLQILVTPASASSTTFKIVGTLIKV